MIGDYIQFVLEFRMLDHVASHVTAMLQVGSLGTIWLSRAWAPLYRAERIAFTSMTNMPLRFLRSKNGSNHTALNWLSA